MKKYTEGIFFKKYWEWFSTPHDVPGVAIANFFSYESADVPGFKRKESLTSVIDLSQSLEQIWKKMRKKFLREQIEKGNRKGVVATESKNFGAFMPMYDRFTRRSDFDAISETALRNGLLFLASFEGQPIAGGVFVVDGKNMRALALASERLDEKNGRRRDIIGEANRIVIWAAISYAKDKGYSLFDLGGIAPDSENAHWRAVAIFKEAFGGERKKAYYYHKIYSRIMCAVRAIRMRF